METQENRLSEKLKIVTWEAVKLLIVIVCIVCLISQVLFMTELKNIQEGQAALYHLIDYNQQEIRDSLLIKTHLYAK